MSGVSDSWSFHKPREEVIGPGEPALTLMRFSHQENASLLVVGTHQREGKDKFLLGSVAEKVLQEAFSPSW